MKFPPLKFAGVEILFYICKIKVKIMCEKTAYKTKKQATTAMNTIKKHERTRNSNEIPKRVYFCSICKNFHLTHYLKP